VAESADYVIVGAGSAGCVLANRLSEDPGTSVLLIEAGGHSRSLNIKIPAAFPKQFETKLDWNYFTDPEPGANGRTLYTPRGKSLGGSSSMNAMLYVRGRPLDYDLWEAQGATGWGWKDVRPYFLRSEDNINGAGEHHAEGGPLRVEKVRSPRPLTGAFLESAEASGIPRIDDYNSEEQDGASPVQTTQREGRRWSAADAFLNPAKKRKNLKVVTGAHVIGLEIENGRCTGVRFAGKGGEQVATAGSEVILSAGAYGSPQILMLSGIGPAAHLAEAGVSTVHDLPGVGENLQDHPYVVGIWDVPGGGSLADAEKPKFLLEWALRKTGPLTSTVAEAFAFIRSKPGLPAADLQFHFAPAYFVKNGFEEYDGHGVTLGPVLISPKSRGRVRLRSADPTAAPSILSGALTETEDVDAMVAGIRKAREIAAAGPLGELLGREIYPGPDVIDAEDLVADARNRVELIYHPVGTCRMGAADDEMAVLDPELRVRGIEGLRVADASVMPVIPGGNTNAPAIMVGEKASDLVLGRAPAGAPAPA
jgi:choline dehydrogenase-like flavoprotein